MFPVNKIKHNNKEINKINRIFGQLLLKLALLKITILFYKGLKI